VSATETITGTSYYRYDVAITAGAEMTNSPQATQCVNAATGLSTKTVAAYALTAMLAVSGVLAL
jgi:hypothetical protein